MARTVAETSKLAVAISAETGPREVGVELKAPLVGALDALVTFDSFTVTATGSNEGWVGLRVKCGDDDLVEMVRLKTGSANLFQARILISGAEYTLTANTTVAAGRVRIQRTGMTVNCYYDAGPGWTLLLSKATFCTKPVILSILAGADALVAVAADVTDFTLETSPNSFYEGHAIQREGTKYPMAKKGHREYKNKVTVQWSKREQAYVPGTVPADDLPDIDKHGLQDTILNLDGYCTFSRASKMAWKFLIKSLMQPETYTVPTGPLAIGMAPGDVRFMSCKDLEMSNTPARVMSISEGADYQLEVDFQEEKELYELVYYGSDTSSPTIQPDGSALPGAVINATAFEMPPQIVGDSFQVSVGFSRPANASWAGSVLYKAFSETGDYSRLAGSANPGKTATVTAVGKDGDVAYIQVTMDWADDTLDTLADLDALLTSPNINLAMAVTGGGNVFFRYATATLVSAGVYKLKDLVYDVTGFGQANSYGAVDAGDVIILDSPFRETMAQGDEGRTLWFKVPSYNFAGAIQTLADVTAISLATIPLHHKPMAPANVKVDGVGIDSTGTVEVPAGTNIVLVWTSRNRFQAGFNNAAYADRCVDDTDFVQFILEFYDGATLKRTVTQTAKTYTYITTDQATDGLDTGTITLKVYQENTLGVSDATQVTITR